MTWALKRQIIYVFLLVVFFSAFAYLVVSPKLNRAPTCTDGKRNGEEAGIDCGGVCEKACIAQVDAVSILWARAFRVIPGRYNAVAYLENHNKNAAINKISYKFRFADKDNIYIGKREGSTFIPPARKFAIFEPAIDIGNSIPVYTTFEFTEGADWVQIPQTKINQSVVSVSDAVLLNEDKSPELSATVKNKSFIDAKDIAVVAILYDANHNAVSASRTYIDALKEEESQTVHFTWLEPFSGKVTIKEIIPMYNFWANTDGR